ncbi:MAG: sigma-70 family RNA polymerase sigma factor [Deltaproteobacteria bacterium]|nr:sigma-70 family RNA polymerase sigma factor [Deltaproteobacteria bacterium]MBN2673845.1 sigma-70 family RNA polymerase sigma factor [Deltaproteobacteria bacterium]
MNDPSQHKLVKQLQARDAHAFEQLIETHQTRIYNLIYRMIGNREESEDLLQEVFITVFKKIDSFRGDSSLTTWIYKIATNHCINRKKYLTRRKHYAKSSYSDLSEKEQAESRNAMMENLPRPDEMAEGKQMELLIQKAIISLEDEYKIVLILRDVQNLSYDEIEQILNVPAGTVKSRLHRARMALKEKLIPYLR